MFGFGSLTKRRGAVGKVKSSVFIEQRFDDRSSGQVGGPGLVAAAVQDGVCLCSSSVFLMPAED